MEDYKKVSQTHDFIIVIYVGICYNKVKKCFCVYEECESVNNNEQYKVKSYYMQKNASNIVGSFMDEIMLEGDDTNR